MNRFVVFLRAVNVSGKNLIKMAELKNILGEHGFQNVQTYIQSGNILLNSDLDKEQVRQKVEDLIQTHFQLAVTAFAYDEAELQKAYDSNPFSADLPGNRVFITFLSEDPKQELRDSLDLQAYLPEEFQVKGRHSYFHLPNGAAQAKLSNAFFEKKLQVKATGRNVNTVRQLLNLLQQTN